VKALDALPLFNEKSKKTFNPIVMHCTIVKKTPLKKLKLRTNKSVLIPKFGAFFIQCSVDQVTLK
jgi:hypothetical protein